MYSRYLMMVICLKIVGFNDQHNKTLMLINMGCSFKYILRVGVQESIVITPRTTDHGSAV
jgi:hypothetical protein